MTSRLLVLHPEPDMTLVSESWVRSGHNMADLPLHYVRTEVAVTLRVPGFATKQAARAPIS